VRAEEVKKGQGWQFSSDSAEVEYLKPCKFVFGIDIIMEIHNPVKSEVGHIEKSRGEPIRLGFQGLAWRWAS
jgi:hypothetical protein